MEDNIKIDPTDPVDIILSVDPDVEKLVDDTSVNDDDYDTLYAGITEGYSEDGEYLGDDDEDDVIDYEYIYDSIDDSSLDYLDSEADDIIENSEDDDADGELIDMAMS